MSIFVYCISRLHSTKSEPYVNHALWVTMIWWFINCNKCTILSQNVDKRRLHMCGNKWYMGNCYTRFAVNLKLLLKWSLKTINFWLIKNSKNFWNFKNSKNSWLDKIPIYDGIKSSCISLFHFSTVFLTVLAVKDVKLSLFFFCIDMLWFLSHFLLCIFHRYFLCGYHEAYRKHLIAIKIYFILITTSIICKTTLLPIPTPTFIINVTN